MKWFKKKVEELDKVEERFQDGVDLVKDLDKTEFNRMVKALELIWQGYDTVRKVKERDEKELDDIDKLEIELEKTK